jgi:hypothetical protein
MNSIDSKISKALKLLRKRPLDIEKSEQTRRQLNDLLAKLRRPELAESLRWANEPTVNKAVQTGKTSFLESSVAARNAGLPQSAVVLLAAYFEAGGELDRENALRVTSNAEGLEIWRKKSMITAKQLEHDLLGELPSIYATSGVEWLLKHADVKKLDPLFHRLLRCDSRPNYMPNWQQTLTEALLKDAKGTQIKAALRAADSPDLGKSLAKVVIQTDVILPILDQLARLAARRETIPGIPILFDEIIRHTFNSDGVERERLSAALTRFIGGVALLNENSSLAEAVMSQIERANRKLKNAISASDSTRKIWLAARYPDNQDVPSGKPQLTIEGAINIATAFRKAAEGFGIGEILTFTAKNLGMLPFGTVGENVVFNPFQHEAVGGGLLRGDQATIVESGWKLGNDIAMRAKVKGMKP